MISVWRIVIAEHEKSAFTGEGARIFGGRWNEIGDAMIYASSSLSLAALEFFVNLDATPPQSMRLLYIEAKIPSTLIKEADNLPHKWYERPGSFAAQKFGSTWIKDQASSVLKVPSVVIPIEFNYLINPKHPDFPKIKLLIAKEFSFDERMWKK